MTYAAAIEHLYRLRWFGARLGLETTFTLAALAGDPQRQLRFIHVAGTNGKGSTCAVLESIYHAAGLRVGLFTSPHLVSFRERLQVDRQLISEVDVVRLVEELQPLLKQFPEEQHPTFFEVVTVMALRYFAEQKCDVVIWETGLGGRLDATNIVTPLASVITKIGYDHQQWLGDSLEKIASEKAGIIKPGVPVITAPQQPEARRVIESRARKNNSPLVLVDAERIRRLPRVPALIGEHQHENAAVSVATVESLQSGLPISAEAIHRGLENVYWPGRLQLITRPNGQRILLDGAHNIDGATVLRDTLHTEAFAARPLTLILGILGDKACQPICELLAPLAQRILIPPVASERTAAPPDLANYCRAANPTTEVIVCNSLAHALERASTDGFIVIAGSLYLIGEAMELLGLSPVPTADEKALNNWQPRIRLLK